MNSQRDDELLMCDLANGRNDALDELMKRWDSRLRCFIERMCGAGVPGDDIRQEV